MGVVKKNKTVIRKSPRQHQCKYCYKVFPFPNVLKKHYRVHTGERPYECDLCGNKFTHQNTLKNHKLCIHNCGREEDFTCGHCDKKFPIKERLIEHVRIHTGYFPHRYFFFHLHLYILLKHISFATNEGHIIYFSFRTCFLNTITNIKFD